MTREEELQEIEPIAKILREVYGVDKNPMNLASLIRVYIKRAYDLGVENRDYATKIYEVMDGKISASNYAYDSFDIYEILEG